MRVRRSLPTLQGGGEAMQSDVEVEDRRLLSSRHLHSLTHVHSPPNRLAGELAPGPGADSTVRILPLLDPQASIPHDSAQLHE